jgi:hypothetical protein
MILAGKETLLKIKLFPSEQSKKEDSEQGDNNAD